ncbi:MAG TPA: fibronectin type III domain-containing protein [Blastocatellia bacterium]|nr:fibronectin type III domain-containing protein [Blastocatellia bacterium]
MKSSAPAFRFLLFAFCLLPFAFHLSGCGKVGDPLPPYPRAPLTVEALTAVQQGDRIVLSFPLSRTPRSILPARIDVYRLIESASDPLALTEETFSARSSVIASIPAGQIPVGTSTVSYSDLINFSAAAGQPRYRYAVRLVNQQDQAAGFSNYAFATPLLDIAAPPTDLKTKLSQTELEITWMPPTNNLNGTQPANVAGYNIYRRSGKSEIRLNAKPLTEPRFTDRTFQFETPYEYYVRALSLLPESRDLATALESNPSAPVAITPKDTFPPAPPGSITIASINGIVSLFWPANSEPDTAGYNIYRAESADTPPEQWVKLNQQLHKSTSFRDDRVQVGRQYFYQMTAVDNNGNESTRSATVSETVNP